MSAETRVPVWRVVAWIVAALVAGAVTWGGLEGLLGPCKPPGFLDFSTGAVCAVKQAAPVVAGVLVFLAVVVGGFARERSLRRAARLRKQWENRDDSLHDSQA